MTPLRAERIVNDYGAVLMEIESAPCPFAMPRSKLPAPIEDIKAAIKLCIRAASAEQIDDLVTGYSQLGGFVDDGDAEFASSVFQYQRRGIGERASVTEADDERYQRILKATSAETRRLYEEVRAFASRHRRADAVVPINPQRAAELYFGLLHREVEDKWPEYQQAIDLVGRGSPPVDPGGLLKVEAVFAAMAVGMIGLPEYLAQPQRASIQTAVLDFLEAFGSAHPLEAWGGYRAAFGERPGGDSVAVGRLYLSRVRDVLRQTEDAADTAAAHLIGSTCLMTTLGAWSAVLDSPEVRGR